MDREGEQRPRVHVWVRVGAAHFDVTWTRWQWDLSQARYRQLGEVSYPRATRVSLLDLAVQLAAEAGIEVAQ
jgi:hypothetical protein